MIFDGKTIKSDLEIYRINPHIILLIVIIFDLLNCDLSKVTSRKASARSTQAQTSASEALAISKKRLLSVFDLLALPSARFRTTEATALFI